MHGCTCSALAPQSLMGMRMDMCTCPHRLPCVHTGKHTRVYTLRHRVSVRLSRRCQAQGPVMLRSQPLPCPSCCSATWGTGLGNRDPSESCWVCGRVALLTLSHFQRGFLLETQHENQVPSPLKPTVGQWPRSSSPPRTRAQFCRVHLR